MHRFDQEEQGLGPVVVCAGKTSAAQPWRWHNADNMRTTMGQRQGDDKPGSVHDEGLHSHNSRPKTGKVMARWRVLSRVGAGGKPNLGDARRTKERHNCKAKEHAAMTAAAPAKRPAQLDGRLSSDGGSARRRGAGQRATYK
jgi:hypothetical protein